MRSANHALSKHAGAPSSQGQISLEFTTDREGRSFLSRQYASYPFHVCKVLYQDSEAPNLATLYLQSCSGGLYKDDNHSLSLVARRDTEVHLTTQASTIVHGMFGGHASQAMNIVAEEGSYIEYLPDPQILFPDASLHSAIHVTMADGATVIVSDALLANDLFSGAAPTLFSSEILIKNASGKPVAIDRLFLRGETFMQRRPGVLGAFSTQATMLIATRSPMTTIIYNDIRALGARFADGMLGVSLLPNTAGCVARVLASDGASLKRAMHALWSIIRNAKYGHAPSARRK